MAGSSDQIIARLYQVFSRDFKDAGCMLRGLPVRWDGRCPYGQLYEEGFWHLISCVNKKTRQRELDTRRAERLSWCKPLITHADELAVTTWDYLEGNRRIRTYLWLQEHDYVVILEKRNTRRGEVAFLVTAYYVEGESTRRRLRKRYRRRLPDVQPPPF